MKGLPFVTLLGRTLKGRRQVGPTARQTPRLFERFLFLCVDTMCLNHRMSEDSPRTGHCAHSLTMSACCNICRNGARSSSRKGFINPLEFTEEVGNVPTYQEVMEDC